MAFEIPDHFHLDFTTAVEHLLQARGGVLVEGVMIRSYTGEQAQVVKQFGEVDFVPHTTRHGDTNFSDIDHKQRWLTPYDYNLALAIDKEDELRMLNSPQSPYAEAMRKAWARRVDQTIINGLLGDNKTGNKGTTTTSFDTANQQIAAGSAGLTISKLREAREKLLSNHVDPMDPMYIAVSAKQVTNLLETTEVTSADYNTVKALVQGDIDTFLGFKFLNTELLGVDGSDDRRCIAWAKSGAVLGQWNGLETKIDERPDKNYLTQVYMRGTIDACRTQEGKVVEILCVES